MQPEEAEPEEVQGLVQPEEEEEGLALCDLQAGLLWAAPALAAARALAAALAAAAGGDAPAPAVPPDC